MKIVGTEAMSRIDAETRGRFAIPSLVLMENAGIKAWAALGASPGGGPDPDARLVFVAGRGNNGGDALIMARQACVQAVRPGWPASRGAGKMTVLLAERRPDIGSDPGADLAMCEALGIAVVQWPQDSEECRSLLAEADWVFDGLAGTGIRGSLRADAARLVDAMNSSPGRRVAIDVPSGVREGFRTGDPAVRAELTLTMGLPKTCLYLPHARELCGRILVVHVGFPPALVEDPALPGETLDAQAWRKLLRRIPPCAHKGTRGHLAVFAGAVGTTGAAWLCATAAARSRVGLVSLFLAPPVLPLLAPRLASVMAKPWDPAAVPGKGGVPAFDPSVYDALLVGPGWGTGQDREPWITLLASSGLPGVIDADGLTLLARLRAAGKLPALGGRWVLTPHPGEFARLAGIPLADVLDDPLQHALRASREMDAVVVLKGACTHIGEPRGKYWILDGCNPALATAGSGDVLAGIIAGAMAGGLAAREAALFGVSLHAHAGEGAWRQEGWFLAEDLLPFLSSAPGTQGR